MALEQTDPDRPAREDGLKLRHFLRSEDTVIIVDGPRDSAFSPARIYSGKFPDELGPSLSVGSFLNHMPYDDFQPIAEADIPDRLRALLAAEGT